MEQNLNQLETSKIEKPEVKPDAGGIQIKVEHSAVIETPITPEMPAPVAVEVARPEETAQTQPGIEVRRVIEVVGAKINEIDIDSAVLHTGRELMKEAA
jgi:hypothetical protein